jgi:hypothetical protein
MGNLNQGDSARTVFAPAAKQHATSSQKDHDAFGDTVIRGLRALLTDTMVELQLSRQELGLANEPFIALAPIDLKLNNHTAFMRDELKLSANDIRGALAKPSAGLISKPEPITIRQLSPSNGYPSELQSILSEIQTAQIRSLLFATTRPKGTKLS